MRNRKLLKILGLIALFLLIIVAWLFINDARRKNAADRPVDTGIENPFGSANGENDLNAPPSNTGDAGEVEQPDASGGIPAPSGTIIIIEDNPILKKLSTNAVAGFAFVSEERDIPESPAATPAAGIVEVFDFSGYKTIRFGDKADEIIAIKTVLNRQTPSPNLIIDVNYDTDMKNAVIDFQNKNGLSGDGVIGAKTYAKLNAFQGITGFTAVKKPKKTETVELARFVESASGLIYDQALRKAELPKTITTNSIPRVVEAYFDSLGTSVVFRYLKDDLIQTYMARLTFAEIDPNLTKEEKDKLPTTAEMAGDYLAENIKSVGVARDGKSFFYLNPIEGGVAGVSYAFSNKAKKQLVATPFTEWSVSAGAEARVSLTTRASGQADGYSFLVDSKSGALSKLVGPVRGLTTLMSPDGKKVLYSESTGTTSSLFVLDVATGKVTSVSPAALPEKCVWTKDSSSIYCAAPLQTINALYPDDWYMGKMSFTDALWRIDLSDMSGNIVYDLQKSGGQAIDATSLALNPAEDYLGFINKKDGILWGFDLKR